MKKLLIMAALLHYSVCGMAAVTSMGDRSCGKWIEGRKSPDAPYALAHESWLAGYLSGYAAATGSDFLSKADGPELVQWITKFCMDNPSKNVSAGAKEIASILNRRK